MDVRLTAEQQQLRDAAAKLADDLGPGSVQDLDDKSRIARLDKQVETTGWRSLRSTAPRVWKWRSSLRNSDADWSTPLFSGPVLADDLARHFDADARGATSC